MRYTLNYLFISLLKYNRDENIKLDTLSNKSFGTLQVSKGKVIELKEKVPDNNLDILYLYTKIIVKNFLSKRLLFCYFLNSSQYAERSF